MGTDLDTPSLKRASRGIYTKSSLREVPEEILHRCFYQEKGIWKVDKIVKQMVCFRHHHFMKDPLPEEMDLVLARYLPFTIRESCATLQPNACGWPMCRNN